MSPSCDWCGRDGSLYDFRVIKDHQLILENPILCHVCRFLLAVPGEVEDIWEQFDGYTDAMLEFETTLAQRWQERQKNTD
jgi:CRISPR/Cas system-associated protein Cas10 (large subunit of type III CRISPR-Cas system)